MTTENKVILDVQNVTMQFGGLKAVDNVQFKIHQNELVGLIGPNGAGKTTMFNVITGVYKPTVGKVFFQGQDLMPFKPWQISKLGMTRTFQNIRLFKELTVLDNVLIAMDQNLDYSLLAPLFQTKKYLQQEQESLKKATELLEIFSLDKDLHTIAGSMPYGAQRKLEIVRALATNPKLICLDEPAAGMNHQETDSLMHLIAQIRKDFNLTVVLIEHDMKLVMGICERILVLDHGVKIGDGSPAEIRSSKQVIAAYLGADNSTEVNHGH